MIYELSVVAKSELSDDQVTKVQEMIHEIVKAHDGDILIQDDWGRLEFAQRAEDGTQTGRFLHFIYKCDNNLNNTENDRRIRINEGILRHLIVKLGLNRDQDKIVKGYKTPYSKTYNGSVLDIIEEKNGGEADKTKRHFARRKNCWFTAHEVTADWKDPKSYDWLINEFGKISPGRVSGISRKHQVNITKQIKRARQIGIASFINNNFAVQA